MITIVVPIFNVEMHLVPCIESVLAQTDANFELLLVDDHSSDRSGYLCDFYTHRDPRIKVIHKSLGGRGSACNAGVSKATGNIITFLNPYDTLEPNYVETISSNIGEAQMLVFGETWQSPEGCRRIFLPGDDECHDRLSLERLLLRLVANQPSPSYDFFRCLWNKAFRPSIISNHSLRFLPGLSDYGNELFLWEYTINTSCVKTINSPIYNHLMAYDRNVDAMPAPRGVRFSLCRMYEDINCHLSHEPLVAQNRLRQKKLIAAGINTDNPWYLRPAAMLRALPLIMRTLL